MPRTLVVCVGNDLVGDDRVGPAIFEKLLRLSLPPTVRLFLVAVGGLTILEELSGEDRLVVVDAVRFGGEPGHIYVRKWDELSVNSVQPCTSHGVGIREALAVGRLVYPERMPAEVFLVGIEGCAFDHFGDMTPAVTAAVDEAVAIVTELALS